MHGQTDDLIGYLVGHGQVLGGCAWQAAIGAESTDEREEISASQHILFSHLKIKLVTGLAIFLCIDEDGEITIVVAHTRHIVEEADTRNIP